MFIVGPLKRFVKKTRVKMESKSPYFSPRKTRNFAKQQAEKALPVKSLKTTLISKSVENKFKNAQTSVTLPKIKIEPKEELDQLGDHPNTPKNVQASNSKELVTEESKRFKWEPLNWRQTLENIRQMRRDNLAPVDTMGCDQFKNDDKFSAKSRRFHTLVSLMLSSQTKDQVNYDCMQRLQKFGLTPENLLAMDVNVLEKLIYPVSFYKNKAKYIKQTSQILVNEHDGDIPNTIEGLLKLPGVGKKMAHLCMRSAWNVVTGIGVDTHVHRICNWLRWVPKQTKTPEETRIALEQWLPFELWEEVNQLLVGFGQTTCSATYPRCNECLNADICPAKGKHGIRKSPVKREIKQEDLEF